MKPTHYSFLLLLFFLASLVSLPVHSAEALAGAEKWQLDFSGLHRSRYIRLENQFRPGYSENDEALSLHTLLMVEAKKGPWTLVGEVQDARNYLNDSDSALSVIEINALEPLQAYANLHLDNVFQEGAQLDARAGRFTMDLGSRRLVARHLYRNTIQNYTGLSTSWRSSNGHNFRGFLVMPVSIKPSDSAGLLNNDIELDEEDPDLQFWGIFYQTPKFSRDFHLDLYMLGLHEQDDENEKQTTDREMLVQGVRLFKPPAAGQWDLDVEFIYQSGSRRASASVSDTRTLDISASFQHLSAGYTFAANWQPRLSAEFDSGSGDDGNQLDLKYGRYDGLFGPRRELGPTSIYGILGRENISATGLKLTLKPTSRTEAYLAFRTTSLDSKVDSFASSGVIDPAGLSGSRAGDQWDFRLRHWLRENKLRLEIGAAVFQNAAFFDLAPNASNAGNPNFFYSELNWFF